MTKRKAEVASEERSYPWAVLAPEPEPVGERLGDLNATSYRGLAAGGEKRIIRCIYESRLNIETAPSGVRYEFEPGQEKPVLGIDYEYLLSLAQQNGCCGGPTTPQKYFEEV